MFHQPDTRGGDEAAVGLASVDDFRVARDKEHAGRLCGRSHRCHDSLEIRKRETFLENESRAEIEGPGPAGGEIVDGPIHRQRADVATRKEQRRDDVRVGRERQAGAAHRDDRLVVTSVEVLVAKRG